MTPDTPALFRPLPRSSQAGASFFRVIRVCLRPVNARRYFEPVPHVTGAYSQWVLNDLHSLRGRTPMLRSSTASQRPRKWALALRHQMQVAIGHQLRAECELQEELPSELSRLLTAKENDPYADIVGTC